MLDHLATRVAFFDDAISTSNATLGELTGGRPTVNILGYGHAFAEH